MDDGLKILAGGWGEAAWDDEEMPVFRYHPPAPAVRDDGGGDAGTLHVAGNAAVKLVASGQGTVFPYGLVGEVPLGLCGDPRRPGQFGGGRLFVVEGGQARPVVGPDHASADHSDVETARLVFAPLYVEKQYDVGALTVRQRLLTPLEGLPAVVSMVSVHNRGEGARWIALFDLWDLCPRLLAPALMQPRLTRKLARVLRGDPLGEWDNGYLKTRLRTSDLRLEAVFEWDEETARRRFGCRESWAVPPLQAVSLTRNVRLHAGARAEMPAGLPPLGSRSEEAAIRMGFAHRFQPKPGETQVGAAVCWLGPWEEARTGLRRLLPIGMLLANEGLLWRKRRCLMRSVPDPAAQPAATWETAWLEGVARNTMWRSSSGGRTRVASGSGCFVGGCTQADPIFAAAATVSLLHTAPSRAREVLEASLAQGLDAMAAWDREADVGSGLVDQLLTTLWALAESRAVAGLFAEPELVERFLNESTELLLLDVNRGPNGLLTTRHVDAGGLVHHLAGVPGRAGGGVESVRGSALLVAAVRNVVAQCMESWPQVCAELEELAAAHHAALETVCGDGRFPRWLVDGEPVGHQDLFAEHLVWLLRAGLAPAMVASLAGQARERLLGPGGWLRTLESPFAERKVRDEGMLAAQPREDPLLHALFLGGLPWSSGELAADLANRLAPSRLGERGQAAWEEQYLLDAEVPHGPQGTTRAGYRGVVAGILGILGRAGLSATPHGVRVRVSGVREEGLETAMLAVRCRGNRVEGRLKGDSEGTRRCFVELGSREEATRWRGDCVVGVREHAGACGVVIQARGNERWEITCEE